MSNTKYENDAFIAAWLVSRMTDTRMSLMVRFAKEDPADFLSLDRYARTVLTNKNLEIWCAMTECVAINVFWEMSP